MGRQLIALLGVCGVATFLVGALTGSWFGDLFGFKALWFDPTKEPLKMLAVSIVLGVIHIFWGIGIKLADNVRRGKIWDALFDQALWLILLSGLAMWLVSGSLKSATVLSVGKGLAAVGAVGIVLFAGRSNKNIFARLGSGLYSLYGVSAYMSDVLSYARLLALGLSGSVVAVVFNLLAKMTLSVPVVGVVFMITILAAGHLFNLVISIISSFVHSSRLQYVEFYGKFYEGGGKRFIPLGVNSKYTQVNRTEEA
jgi:V/A-type H+-transporting ATPase subunit I